jgi:hypothetical protein
MKGKALLIKQIKCHYETEKANSENVGPYYGMSMGSDSDRIRIEEE